jgi:hypothetical protein
MRAADGKGLSLPPPQVAGIRTAAIYDCQSGDFDETANGLAEPDRIDAGGRPTSATPSARPVAWAEVRAVDDLPPRRQHSLETHVKGCNRLECCNHTGGAGRVGSPLGLARA